MIGWNWSFGPQFPPTIEGLPEIMSVPFEQSSPFNIKALESYGLSLKTLQKEPF
jgi:hypothetical protein